MNRNKTPIQLTNEDGPFRYTYLWVTAFPGMCLHDQGECVEFQSFPELGARAVLTTNSDPYCEHMDRSAAISLLLLTGFRGQSKFGRVSANWNRLQIHVRGLEMVFRKHLGREMAAAHRRRHKDHGNLGCYLIYQAQGELLEPPQLGIARKIGRIGFGFDIIRSAQYKGLHWHACHAAATALSLALVETNGSPETHVVGDIVYLTGKDNLVVYPKTVEMGTPGITVSTSFRPEILEAAGEYIPTMLDDASIETAISLFVESQKKENDNLHSFIAAWSALELLVNRLAKLLRQEWQKIQEEQVLPKWDTDLRGLPTEDYRLRDRFFSIACVFDLARASADAALFVHVNNMRSGFYHRMDVRDCDLPTNDVQALFRKYLKNTLSHQSELK